VNGWTDYPILELGDLPGVEAPIRKCEVLSFDQNKYCRVWVEGIETEIKGGYLYPQKGRCGEVPCFTLDQLLALPIDHSQRVTP